MNALDYPIELGFGDYGVAGYTKARPHKGNDYSAGLGVPVIVAGTQIGLTGSTGNVTGPHVHVQAGPDIDSQQAVEPKPYTNKPGVVVQAEERSAWGKFVNIKVGDMYVHYCHLSRIDVKVGQEIGGHVKPTAQDIKQLGGEFWGMTVDDGTAQALAQMTWPEAMYYLADAWPWRTRKAQLGDLSEQNAKLTAANAALQDELRTRPADSSDAEKRLKAIQDALGIK